jgi:signal transduction histidine kinase/CheY-like chemotaxis protein
VSSTPTSFGEAESHELLALAQEAGRVGIFEWQVSTGTIRLSPRFLSLYGLNDFDGRFESWIGSIHREDRVRIADLIESALATQSRELQAEFRLGGPPGSQLRWMELRAIVFYGENRKAARVVGVSVDVTERKRALAELRAFTEVLEEGIKARTRELEAEFAARTKAEESLRQAQKMEAVGQLTGGVAHDFNNLLTVVLGGLDMIGRQVAELPSSPAVARIIRAKDMALHGAQRAATLTARLLAFSRQQALAPQSIDANKLVAATCELLRRTLGEAVSLETVLAAGLWRTFADPGQLENALINLALNARDAMPKGGKLTIETANCYLDQTHGSSLLEPVASGQYVMIGITDTGIGMDKATQERAFDPFFTTKEVGKGTGLGLSQVYGFVRQSDGHVRIYSEPGEGTTIKIYLRRHVGAENPRAVMDQLSDTARAIGAETVLVAEDDDSLRSFTTEILRELGYGVLEARDGDSALKVLDKNHVDLLFTDVVMPSGMNGRQLADEAMRRQPQLKVLFTTGYTRNAIVHHGRLDAGVEMIGKPFSFVELSAKVRAILDR